jgi:DNA-binding LacI/PurR family transcriptional regulator/biotin operon repressor
LRGELMERVWSGMMPGSGKLARELGVGPNTVEAALGLLEKEGLLVSQGRRRGRRIELPGDWTPASLRVAILIYDSTDRHWKPIVDLRYRLEEAGHTAVIADQTLTDLGMDVEKTARYVKRTEADAWVVIAAPREILQWFAAQPAPAFALFGRHHTVDIAAGGISKLSAYRDAVRVLVARGHSRIVLICRESRRKPAAGLSERTFIEALENEGVQVGDYNLPDWEDNKESLYQRLDALFQVTQPTALVVQQTELFFAVQQFLLERGIRVPQDVSMICTDPSGDFEWCQPSVAHFELKITPLVRRVGSWVNRVARGQEDLRKSESEARFVDGGTIGLVKF